jgi:L-glutamine-phosphate cytidylyltransferase
MKAIILAAGKGSRLYPITLNKPKGLLRIGDETILDRLIRQFREANIHDIVIVVGYQKEKLIEHFEGSVRFLEYSNYSETNNLHTLWSIREELDDNVIISFSDLMLHSDVVNELIESNNDITLAVDTSQVIDGTMRVKVQGDILQSIKTTSFEEASGNFIGLAAFKNKGCQRLVNEMSKLVKGNYDDYYTLAIDRMARRSENVACLDIAGLLWREIDTRDEYNEAKKMLVEFNNNRKL